MGLPVRWALTPAPASAETQLGANGPPRRISIPTEGATHKGSSPQGRRLSTTLEGRGQGALSPERGQGQASPPGAGKLLPAGPQGRVLSSGQSFPPGGPRARSPPRRRPRLPSAPERLSTQPAPRRAASRRGSDGLSRDRALPARPPPARGAGAPRVSAHTGSAGAGRSRLRDSPGQRRGPSGFLRSHTDPWGLRHPTPESPRSAVQCPQAGPPGCPPGPRRPAPAYRARQAAGRAPGLAASTPRAPRFSGPLRSQHAGLREAVARAEPRAEAARSHRPAPPRGSAHAPAPALWRLEAGPWRRRR